MFQILNPVPNWLDAVRLLPPKALVKAASVQWLSEAKAANPGIVTVLRYVNDPLQDVNPDDTDEVRANRARHWFDCFIDGTFLDGETAGVPHWRATDMVSWWNEYTATGEDPAVAELFWRQERIAAQVWRDEYRVQPKLAHIRLAICAIGVGNDIPLQSAYTAHTYDCVLDYHMYDKYLSRGVRDPLSWQYHCGRWATMDADFVAHGYTCDWIGGEAGPYKSTPEGWRAPDVLNADATAYVEAVRTFIRECRTTPAFREGRLLGFSLFQSGNPGWEWYETHQPELNALASMIAQEWTMPTTDPYTFGIDVSRYQGTINWAKVAGAGVKFAAIRCTVGDYYTDPTWDTNHAQARANGILATAYHVVKPSKSVTAQIARFREVVGDRVLDIVPALDVELTDGLGKAQVTGCILGCVAEVKRLFGCTPLIYTGDWFWRPNVVPGTASECPLWIAHYTDAAQPLIPTGTWQDWAIWQYSSNTMIAGITLNTVDKNRAKALPLMPVPEPEPMPDPCAELARQLADCQVQLAEVTASRDAAWALLLQIRNLADGMV